MPTLSQLYENVDSKTVISRILVNGQPVFFGGVTSGFSLNWSYGWGQAATCTIELPGQLPAVLSTFSAGRRPNVQVYVGFDGIDTLVFTGGVMDAANTEHGCSIACVGEGRRLEIPYKRTLLALSSTDSETAIATLLDEAGVIDYAVDLTNWTIATTGVIALQFATYGEAINRIAQVYGSPWYEMPDGQIRVELKDPLPGPTPFRQYFSGKLLGLTAAQRNDMVAGTLTPADIQPAGITNASARPRLISVERRDFPRNVRNKVTILGAVVQTTEANGTTSSTQVETSADADSPWIPTPPGTLEVTISNELVDTEAVASAMAIRYTTLYNRLETILSTTVMGDPEIFLGATVEVNDPDYSGTTGRWFVYGYQSSLNASGFTTRLDLRGGGPAAGSTPKVDPFACFSWATTGKVDQLLPVGIGPGGRGIIVTFDGRCSRDPDGSIASYAWSDNRGNSGSGAIVSFAYNPATQPNAAVTLTVTDNDGRTDSITKNVNITSDDELGQQVQDVYIFCAAGTFAMGSSDGGVTWNDLSNAVAGVTGDFVHVTAQYYADGVQALFITDEGELVVTTDVCATGFKPKNTNGDFVTLASFTPETFSVVPYLCPSASAWLIFGRGMARPVFLFYASLTDTPEQEFWWLINNFALQLPPPHTAAYKALLGWQTPLQKWPEVSAIQREFTVDFLGTGNAVMVMGGDSATPNSLVRVANFTTRWERGDMLGDELLIVIDNAWQEIVPYSPYNINGALLTAVQAAGAGHHVIGASWIFGMPGVTILFDTGVTPRAWFATFASIAAAPVWSAMTGLAAGVNGVDMAAGSLRPEESLALLANTRTYYSENGASFVDNDAEAEQFNDLFWEDGMKKVYLAAANGGIYKTIDGGNVWGSIRPHAGIGTTWPAGAVGHEVVMLGSPPAEPTAQLILLGSANYHRLINNAWAQGIATPDANSHYLRTWINGRAIHMTNSGNSPNAFRISIDQGITWPAITNPAGYEGAQGADWLPSGRLILAFVDTTPAPDVGVVYYSDNDGSVLTALGATWQLNRVGDVACHPTNSNYIAVAYETTGGLLNVRVSSDAGVNWTNRQVDAGAFSSAKHRVFWMPNNRLVVVYELTAGTFKIATSDDLGANFTVRLTIAIGHLFSAVRAGTSGPLVVVVDRDSGASAGIFLRSADYGDSWEALDSPLADSRVIKGIDYDAATDRLLVYWG